MDSLDNKAPLSAGVRDAAIAFWSVSGSQQWIPINGESMYPTFHTGDQVLVDCQWDNLRRGDVCVFCQADKLVVHRVVRVEKTDDTHIFVTRGDNTTRSDAPVCADAVVGRVIALRRGERTVSLDTVVWRAVGECIAMTLLCWSAGYARIRTLVRGASGTRLYWLFTRMRISMLALGKACLRGVQPLLWRAKS